MPRLKVVWTAALLITISGSLCATQNAAFALDMDEIEEALPRLRRELPGPALSRRVAEELPAIGMADPREELEDIVPSVSKGRRLPPRAIVVVLVDVDD